MVADAEVHGLRERLRDRHLIDPVASRSPALEQPRHLDGPAQAIVGDGTERLELPVDVGDELPGASHVDDAGQRSERLERVLVDRGPEDPELRRPRLDLHAIERRIAPARTGDRRQEDCATERHDQCRGGKAAPVSSTVSCRAHAGRPELAAGELPAPHSESKADPPVCGDGGAIGAWVVLASPLVSIRQAPPRGRKVTGPITTLRGDSHD